jgi:hypothetical protein
VIVLAVWKNRIPDLPGDIEIWNPDKGFLVPIYSGKKGPKKRKKWSEKKEIFHGMTLWAQIRGRAIREKVRFDEIDRTFPSPDLFAACMKAVKVVRRHARAQQKSMIDAIYHVPQDVPMEVLPPYPPASPLPISPVPA